MCESTCLVQKPKTCLYLMVSCWNLKGKLRNPFVNWKCIILMGHNIYFVNSINRHLEKTWHKFLGRGGLSEIKYVRSVSRSVLSASLWPTRLLCPWDFPDKNTGVGSHSLLKDSIPIQGLNQILYHLSHQGSSGEKHI